jgi:23S rRNA (pseudouridine1915-N3)-methyltransferase
MKVQIICMGVLKLAPLKALWEMYQKRLLWHLELIELPTKNDSTTEIQSVLKALRPQTVFIVLDEKGENMSTVSFASFVEKRQLLGTKSISFLIGGPDGIDAFLKKKADYLLSFGAQTWPHDFVRVLLIEQIYRVQQILNGHPYHRAS